MMHAYYLPGITYDDIAICNAVGVYKNGSSWDKEDEIFKNLTGKNTKTIPTLFTNDEVSIFPNPTTGLLNIKYNLSTDAVFGVYDMSGRVVFTTHLGKGEKQVTAELPNVTPGVYTYKIIGSSNHYGKIVVE